MDSGRFESLVNEHKDAVYRQMIRVCGKKEDAEDALATAMMHAFLASDQLGSESAFRSWLGTIGKRVCTRMRSHSAIQQVLEYAEDRDLIDPKSNEMEMAVLKGCVRDAVEELKPGYKEVYQLCELEERTLEEAANALDITVAAAKSRLHRARQQVRATLDRSICGAESFEA